MAIVSRAGALLAALAVGTFPLVKWLPSFRWPLQWVMAFSNVQVLPLVDHYLNLPYFLGDFYTIKKYVSFHTAACVWNTRKPHLEFCIDNESLAFSWLQGSNKSNKPCLLS